MKPNFNFDISVGKLEQGSLVIIKNAEGNPCSSNVGIITVINSTHVQITTLMGVTRSFIERELTLFKGSITISQ
jgi:hypothetical protein